jgi:hypothetical protein
LWQGEGFTFGFVRLVLILGLIELAEIRPLLFPAGVMVTAEAQGAVRPLDQAGFAMAVLRVKGALL